MADPLARQAGALARYRWYRAYVIALLVVLVVGIAVWLLPRLLEDLPGSLSFYLLIALAIVADTPPFTLVAPAEGARREGPAVISASVCFTFAISMGWRGAATISQVAAVAVAAAVFRRPLWRSLFDVGRYGLAIFFVGRVLAIGSVPIHFIDDVLDETLILTSALAWFVVFHVLTAVEEWLRTDQDWWWVLRHHLGEEALSAGALLVLAIMVVALVRLDGWILLLTLLPLYSVSRMVRLAHERIGQARRDLLTGLPNRTALAIEVDRQINYPADGSPDRAFGRRFAVALTSVDSLTYINEALGYQVGEEVLRAVAARLPAAVGRADMPARVGSDEFAVLITQVADDGDVRRRTGEIAAALRGPTSVNHVPLHVTYSTGVAIYPDHGHDFVTLLRHAKAAMQQAKERTLPVMLYQAGSRPDGVQRLSLLAELRDAVTGPHPTGIGLHYQPQVAMDTGEVVGVEALLRWRAPHHGPVEPDLVITAAEQSDLMFPLTQRAIEQTLTDLARWRTDGLRLRASVNISVRDLYQPEFPEWIAGRLAESGIPPQQIQLEVTETALMTQLDRVVSVLHQLRDQNIAISLDDFGTGYSSLQRLRRLPVTEVKIDRSFVTSLSRNPADQAVVHAIVDIAHRLGRRVVAEGVQDEAARGLLLANDCDVAQGWFYAPAMPADQLAAWISDRHGRPDTSRGGSGHTRRPPGGDSAT